MLAKCLNRINGSFNIKLCDNIATGPILWFSLRTEISVDISVPFAASNDSRVKNGLNNFHSHFWPTRFCYTIHSFLCCRTGPFMVLHVHVCHNSVRRVTLGGICYLFYFSPSPPIGISIIWKRSKFSYHVLPCGKTT